MSDRYLSNNTENDSSSGNRLNDPFLLFYRFCLTFRNNSRNLCGSDVNFRSSELEHRCQRIMKK